MKRRSYKLIALAVLLMVVAAACGQKPGVSNQIALGGGLPPGATVDESGNIVDESGNIIQTADGSTTDFGTTGGSSSGTTGGSTSGTGGSTGTTGGSTGGTTGGTGGTGGSSAAAGEPTGGVATGVTNTQVKLGSHAPLTGAAPVPSQSSDRAKDIYFNWQKAQNKALFGREVVALLKNDQYNPSTAVAVCKEQVEKDKVFMLSGAAGTDQIQACARYAASVGVPYLSAGVTEVGLRGLPNYFATSMSYAQQGPLLVDLIVSKLGGKSKKNGMLWFNTPNFKDAHDAFTSAMGKAGAKLDYDRAVSKNSDINTARTVVQEMSTQNIQNIYVLTSPVWFIEVIKAANAQGFAPQWTGVGITMTFDTVLTAACPSGASANGMQFFAPFPAWIDSNKFDPDFRKATQQFYGNDGDDFIWLGWSSTKMAWTMLGLAGQNLTRERFTWFLERAKGLKNGVGPQLSYAPDNHFGANQVHLLESNCSDRRWHTKQSFVSDF